MPYQEGVEYQVEEEHEENMENKNVPPQYGTLKLFSDWRVFDEGEATSNRPQMAFDQEDNLYICLSSESTIWEYSPYNPELSSVREITNGMANKEKLFAGSVKKNTNGGKAGIPGFQDGTEKEILLNHPLTLAVHGNYLYFLDYTTALEQGEQKQYASLRRISFSDCQSQTLCGAPKGIAGMNIATILNTGLQLILSASRENDLETEEGVKGSKYELPFDNFASLAIDDKENIFFTTSQDGTLYYILAS